MSDDAISLMAFPSDSSYRPKMGFPLTPPRAERPRGLSEETALAILTELPANIWDFDESLYNEIRDSIRDGWSNLRGPLLYWNGQNLFYFVLPEVNAELEKWAEAPYYGSLKPALHG